MAGFARGILGVMVFVLLAGAVFAAGAAFFSINVTNAVLPSSVWMIVAASCLFSAGWCALGVLVATMAEQVGELHQLVEKAVQAGKAS